MKKKAIIVHINPFGNVTPLQGGYMKAFAEEDPEVRGTWDIELYSAPTTTSSIEILDILLRKQPDLVALSCYVWNMGVFKRVLPAVSILLPRAHVLLGGVQVIHQARLYVNREWERVITCDGEGERTFRDLLLELGSSAPDFTAVRGITFQAAGEYVTTAANDRIRDLSEIPSPWLRGMFRPEDMSIALFETNRGCPYKCQYCFWGGAIGQKINRFPLERIKDELTYIARAKSNVLFFIDANFGIFEHDVELAEHLVKAFERYGRPARVNFSSAKNQPDRVERISQLLVKSGMYSTHPISLQTLNPAALNQASRQSIKTDNYIRLQKRLNELGVPSFIEMIWPLPGETLESFKNGLSELCLNGAQSFTVYPLLLMNNVRFSERQEELGIVSIAEEDAVGEGKAVVQTNEVSYEEYKEGIRFVISLHLLHVIRGLYATGRILDAIGVMRVRELVDAFSAWIDAHPDATLARYRMEILRNIDRWFDYRCEGGLVEFSLHTARTECDRIFYDFAMSVFERITSVSQKLLGCAVAFDLLNRPYAYQNTALTYGIPSQYATILEKGKRGFVVELECDVPQLLRRIDKDRYISDQDLGPHIHKCRFRVSHQLKQIFRLPNRDNENLQYCHTLSREVGLFVPHWQQLPLDESALGSRAAGTDGAPDANVASGT